MSGTTNDGSGGIASTPTPTYKSTEIPTKPYDDQKPGTSGLRKKVAVFMQPNYTENFIQCILNTLDDKVKNSTLIVGGDGRYYSLQAINIIIRIAAANQVGKLIIGQRGIFSTPAVSTLIRRQQNILGGIVLTASHNPGGIRHDFGIKYNIENGGPAPDSFTNELYKNTKSIKTYKYITDLDPDFQQLGIQRFIINDNHSFIIEVVDSTETYVDLMKDIFDFTRLRQLIRGTSERKPFNVLIDSMNGVTGVYVKRIFVDELGASPDHNVRRIIPLDNFGEIHPDPNLTYARDLVEKLHDDHNYDLGAAFDGDGDRNMIIGKNAFFITPSDSLAVLADNLTAIPYFERMGFKGFARSMPTSTAVDLVAYALGKEMFEVPTGWKYFGNLMDAGRLSLCGEESFGTGSDHIREKDGIWAVLAWLSVIDKKGMGVEDIMNEHWIKYGRNYYTRYDYEDCDTENAEKIIKHLENLIKNDCLIGAKFHQQTNMKEFIVKTIDSFSYVDPIDNSVATNQGIRVLFEDGSRIIYRLSGTGSSGATIRIYIELYEKDNINGDVQTVLAPLIKIALDLSKLKEFTGREEPTVIT